MSDTIPQALFLDRDGTLIRWVHYLSDPEGVELAPGIVAALRKAKACGCLLFMHTNQSGVGRGYFGVEAVEAVNERMYELMGVDRFFFDGVCIATDRPDRAAADSYRKPSPRFELEMVSKFGLNPVSCYVVGDRVSDLRTGINAGMRSILVPSEQTGELELPEGVLVYKSVAVFVETLF